MTTQQHNLVMDYYQLTMTYAHFKEGRHKKFAYFDMYYRKNPDGGGYTIFNGLDALIEYIENFRFTESDLQFLREKGDFDDEFLEYLRGFRFRGDIWCVPDGTVMFPNEPILTVRGNLVEAQLIETKLLLLVNYASLVSTKANRIATAAGHRTVLEFGTRRAHGETAAVEGAKYAYIAGCGGTACVETEKRYGILSTGTMAHSFIESYPGEYEAFLAYGKTFPSKSIFLVDTYNTLKSGVPNAIRVAKEYLEPNGYRLKGVRLDSGDLAYLSIQTRKMLDAAGMEDCQIVASNSLDEYLIRDLISQGAKIDTFGVGEKLITARSDPVFGGVYKLVAVEENEKIIPKIKLSENSGKLTNPGYKRVYRFYDRTTGYALGDVVALHDEKINPDRYTLIDPSDEWKRTTIENYRVVELQKPIFQQGALVYDRPDVEQCKAYCTEQVGTIYKEITRLSYPHTYYVDLSIPLLNLRKQLLKEHKSKLETGGPE